MAKSDPKLDAILLRLNKLDTLDSVVDKLDSLSATVNSISAQVNTLQGKVECNTQSIANLRSEFEHFKEESTREMRSVKNTLNWREQQLRANTVRLFNFPVGPDETSNLPACMYDRIIKPLLTAAKAAGDIASVPQVQNTLETAYRAFTQEEPVEGAPPPPIVIRFATRALKIATLKQRRHNMPEPSEGEKRVGVKRFVIVEDLTPPAHKLLKALQADSRTDKVWSVNGQICYSVPNKSGYKKVRSVFDSVDIILAK